MAVEEPLVEQPEEQKKATRWVNIIVWTGVALLLAVLGWKEFELEVMRDQE